MQGNPVEPLAPSNLEIKSASNARFALSWTDNSPNESGFILERKNGSAGTWSQIATIGANETGYIDSLALNPDSLYSYRIKATNSGLLSAFSNMVSSRPYIQWQGFSSDWYNRNNWSHFILPDSTCDVYIPAVSAGGNAPSSNSSDYGKIRKLILESGSQLDIPTGKQLEVTED